MEFIKSDAYHICSHHIYDNILAVDGYNFSVWHPIPNKKIEAFLYCYLKSKNKTQNSSHYDIVSIANGGWTFFCKAKVSLWQSIFSKILIMDIPIICPQGEAMGCHCEFLVRIMFHIHYCCNMCSLILKQESLILKQEQVRSHKSIYKYIYIYIAIIQFG